jgi:hypothetical protein
MKTKNHRSKNKMFTQVALSLESSNYIFKVKLNEEAVSFFEKSKSKIEKHIEDTEVQVSKDEYEGELVGLHYKDVQKDFMMKEMNRWMKFFEDNGLEVYEAKITKLSDRLKELNKIPEKDKEKIKELEN